MKKRIFLLTIILILSMTCIIYASDNTFQAIEKSESFKKWESSATESDNYYILPRYSNIEFKDSIKRSRYNNLFEAKLANLGSSYNSSDTIPFVVKNQRLTSSCWSFAFTSLLEGNWYKNSSTSKEFSPMHIEYYTTNMFKRNLDGGGNAYLALAYSTSGNGPVLEENMPMSEVYNESSSPVLTPVENVNLDRLLDSTVSDANFLPSIHKTYDGGSIQYTDGGTTSYSTEEVTAMRDLIKEAIKNNGGISASMYMDVTVDAENNYTTTYYNKDTYAYYCDSSSVIENHNAVIVGWDDNYSKDNFNEGHRPANDGAYIVLNSYGNQFGDNGYIYVSYDDCVIENNLVTVENIDEIDYDKIYQYDPLGDNNVIQVNGSSSGYAANVFSRDASKSEYLNEVGISLFATQGIEIYLNPASADFESAKLVASTEPLEAGYHTIKLATPQKLTGDKFVVIVKYINQEGVFIPIECNLTESGFTSVSNFFDTATANDGESFISTDGETWHDVNGLQLQNFTLKNTNTCIKAFTTYSDEPINVNVESVSLDKNNLDLKVGNSDTLVATVLPENATNKNVTWSSSDDTIAKVEDGTVTAIAPGEATITVTTVDGNKTATCDVTVSESDVEDPVIHVEDVVLTPANLEISVGGESLLDVGIVPSNATNKKVIWASEDPNIATVNNGLVTGISIGETIITATSEDGNKIGKCNVFVSEPTTVIPIEGISVSPKTLDLEIYQSAQLEVRITPENATFPLVDWSSSDDEIAYVDATGKVTARSTGTATITATSEDGKISDSCIVTVTENNTIYVEDISVNPKTLELETGKQRSLEITFTPINATNKNVTWTSSDESVATVNSEGIITALKEGTTTITVTTEDGNKTDSCELTVIKKQDNPDDIYDDDNNNVNIDDDNNNNNNSNNSNNDNNNIYRPSRLPDAGKAMYVIIFVVVTVFGIVAFIKYKRYKNIK